MPTFCPLPPRALSRLSRLTEPTTSALAQVLRPGRLLPLRAGPHSVEYQQGSSRRFMLAGWGVGQQPRPGGGGPSSLAPGDFGARLCEVRAHVSVARAPLDRPGTHGTHCVTAHVGVALVVGSDHLAPRRAMGLRLWYVYSTSQQRNAVRDAYNPPCGRRKVEYSSTHFEYRSGPAES